MKKENIYVEITNETERLRAIEILQNAGEEIMSFNDTDFELCLGFDKLVFTKDGWWIDGYADDLTKITLNELEALLSPKKSNVFTEVQELIKQHFPDKELIVSNTNDDCLRRLEQHLIDYYPKGTKVKISKDKIEIYHS
jgi:hypothetical protein